MTRDWRLEFPVTEHWAFLNHAAVAPLCRRARDVIREYADDMAENGNVHEARWWSRIEDARAMAARSIGAQPTEIALVKNTSEGLAFIAEGLDWRVGDNVVIAAGEYPANVYPWMHLASKGVAVKTVARRGARIALEDLAAAIDSRTRLLSLSFVQFATGFRSDLAAVGAMCRDRGVDFCVDAIQGLGVHPIDVEAMKIDYLAADGHKWLVAPEGAGICYVRSARLERIRPVSIGWKSVVGMHDYSTIDFRLRPDASRFEGGSFNVVGLVALGASLSLLEEIGIAVVERRVRELTDYLIDRLAELGADVFSPRGAGEWSGIVSFSVPGTDPSAIVPKLKERGVVISRRDGRFRASPHFYNNREDIDRLLTGLREG